jgi:hypothetical protein
MLHDQIGTSVKGTYSLLGVAVFLLENGFDMICVSIIKKVTW